MKGFWSGSHECFIVYSCSFVDVLVARDCGVSLIFFLSEFNDWVNSSAVRLFHVVLLDIVDTKIDPMTLPKNRAYGWCCSLF
jgi:hypothetical protein